MKTILINDLSELTPEYEYELYRELGETRVGFILYGTDNAPVLDAMRHLRSILVPVCAYIETSDPVKAMMGFLDAAELTNDITIMEVPDKALERFGLAPYARLYERATEVAKKRGIHLVIKE